MVTEGVELLVHRPLEVTPFIEDEPQVLRNAYTREAFVRLVHYFLLVADVSLVMWSRCLMTCCVFDHDADVYVDGIGGGGSGSGSGGGGTGVFGETKRNPGRTELTPCVILYNDT